MTISTIKQGLSDKLGTHVDAKYIRENHPEICEGLNLRTLAAWQVIFDALMLDLDSTVDGVTDEVAPLVGENKTDTVKTDDSYLNPHTDELDLEYDYFSLYQYYAHQDTVNHRVSLSDGSRQWVPMTAQEKQWYKEQIKNVEWTIEGHPHCSLAQPVNTLENTDTVSIPTVPTVPKVPATQPIPTVLLPLIPYLILALTLVITLKVLHTTVVYSFKGLHHLYTRTLPKAKSKAWERVNKVLLPLIIKTA